MPIVPVHESQHLNRSSRSARRRVIVEIVSSNDSVNSRNDVVEGTMTSCQYPEMQHSMLFHHPLAEPVTPFHAVHVFLGWPFRPWTATMLLIVLAL